MALPYKLSRYWQGDNGQEFELIAVYCPNEEPDPWARYRSILEDREFNCRLEAFQSRFRPMPE